MENLKYYTEGDELYIEMFEAIVSANASIDIESYIFSNDEIGNEFVKLLLDKDAQGVRVRVLIDSVGSNRFKNFKFFKKLSKNGVQLKWFNPWSWRDPFKFNRRNHRKLMVIDACKCFLGGFNLNRNSSKKYFGENRWKDSHISFEGPLSKLLNQQYDLIFKGKLRQLDTISSIDKLTKVLPNSSKKCRKQLRCRYLAAIIDAKNCIKVTTPYFVPDAHMLKALISRAQSGVEIVLLIPKYSDHAILKYAAYWYYQKLLIAGIKIFEFSNRMLHSKTMVIDRDLAVIGSANMDYRSFFLNNEIMLFSKRHELITYIRNDFDESIQASQEVTLKETSKRSSFSLIGTFIAYQLRKWL